MNRRDLYAIPVLGRYGLTHGILAWARCRLWCHQNGANMVAPFWLKLRVGPYLRRERDKRNYFLLFHAGNAISGLGRLALRARAALIDIGPEWPDVPPPGSRPQLLRFHNALQANDKKSFWQIVGHQQFLRRELMAITRPRYHPPRPARPFIAIHVRLGDFTIVTPGDAVAAGSTNTRLPLEWYGDRLDALRAALGENVPAIVFSDGSDAELAPLLARADIARAPRQQSITDLLQMGDGAAVIASGSGFSMWGAFLGSAPRLSFPGQARVAIFEDGSRDIESDFASEIDPAFVDAVRQRLTE